MKCSKLCSFMKGLAFSATWRPVSHWSLPMDSRELLAPSEQRSIIPEGKIGDVEADRSEGLTCGHNKHAEKADGLSFNTDGWLQ